MRVLVPALAAALAAGAVLASVATAAADAPVASYEVTIADLTGGQPLTPPLVATHRAATGLFTVGRPASFGLKEIAENGNLAPMIARLESDKHVADVAAAAAPLVPSGLPGSAVFGDTVTLTVTASEGAKFLSFASMLICTNDGFTGVDSLRLPKKVGDTVTVESAGTTPARSSTRRTSPTSSHPARAWWECRRGSRGPARATRRSPRAGSSTTTQASPAAPISFPRSTAGPTRSPRSRSSA